MQFVETWGQFIILMVTMIGMTGTMWAATNRRLERLEDRMDRFESKLGELAERVAKLEAQMRIIVDRLLPASASSD